jgi:hypothetical protein
MKKLTLLLGLLTVMSSTSVFAEVQSFSGASHCNEDIKIKTKAYTELVKEKGTLNALNQVMTENIGTHTWGQFTYDPTFARSERVFRCSIPLTESMGNVDVTVSGVLTGLNKGRPGGCSFNRIKRVSDGGIWKWFSFKVGKGFWWTEVMNSSTPTPQHVNYTTSFQNEFEGNATLELKCRTTWDVGTVALGQITLSY